MAGPGLGGWFAERVGSMHKGGVFALIWAALLYFSKFLLGISLPIERGVLGTGWGKDRGI